MPVIIDVTHVNFGLKSDTLDPAKITSVLGLEPVRAWKKDDPFTSKTGVHRRPWGIWAISSHVEIVSEDPKLHLRWLHERLERRAEALADIRRQMTATANIKVRWNTNASIDGYSLDSFLVAQLCPLCDRFDMTFCYKCTPEESHEGEQVRGT